MGQPSLWNPIGFREIAHPDDCVDPGRFITGNLMGHGRCRLDQRLHRRILAVQYTQGVAGQTPPAVLVAGSIVGGTGAHLSVSCLRRSGGLRPRKALVSYAALLPAAMAGLLISLLISPLVGLAVVTVVAFPAGIALGLVVMVYIYFHSYIQLSCHSERTASPHQVKAVSYCKGFFVALLLRMTGRLRC